MIMNTTAETGTGEMSRDEKKAEARSHLPSMAASRTPTNTMCGGVSEPMAEKWTEEEESEEEEEPRWPPPGLIPAASEHFFSR